MTAPTLSERLLVLAKLREGAPLHDSSATEAAWLREAAAELDRLSPFVERTWYASEYIDRLVRELDVALNGDGAALQARLCDVVAQVVSDRWRLVRADELARLESRLAGLAKPAEGAP